MAEENTKTIYDLELHESLNVQTDSNYLIINRVPGGWVYNSYVGGTAVSSTFVPLSNEFKKKKKHTSINAGPDIY